MCLVSVKQFHVLMVFLLLLCGLHSSHAAIPAMLNYQAFLTDDNGVPVDGLVSMSFKIYDVEVGGVELWSDNRTVNVVQGQFSIELGETGNPFPLNLFETPLWIGLTIETDSEMLPRRPITSTGYSFKAQDANTLEGSTAAALDQSAHVGDLGNPHNVTAAQTGAIDAVNFSNHVLNISAHHTRYTDGEAVLAILGADGSGSALDADTVDGIDSTGFGSAALVNTNQADISALQAADVVMQSTIDALQVTVAQLQAQNATLTRLLDSLTVSTDSKQIYITGANLHVRSGSGTTNGAENGLGNVIVGYNEDYPATTSPTCSLGEYVTDTDCTTNGGVWAVSHKSGSHNLVVGAEHNYSRSSGIVAGFRNRINGHNASILGGFANISSNTYATISGGWGNTASGELASVSGGQFNTASGYTGSVSGGGNNEAEGLASWVGSGEHNRAIGAASSIAGGGGAETWDGNLAVANYSAILGGLNNLSGDGNCATHATAGRIVCTAGADNAIGEQSIVSGGQANTANGPVASVGGGGENVASGDRSSVSGGFQNAASALAASVSGGEENTASGISSAVSGGLQNAATTDVASVSGGRSNTASGNGASVSGGQDNVAEAVISSVTGGQFNNVTPLATAGIVSGGFQNTASGVAASVSGGQENEASGVSSSVSGGRFNEAIGLFSSVSGGGDDEAVYGNDAVGDYSSISGGVWNVASGTTSSISGGQSNGTLGISSSVSGGAYNDADGDFSSVSGGQFRDVTGASDWRAGTLFEDN